jgi:hypothetical protein
MRKRERRQAYISRARADLEPWLEAEGVTASA